MAVSPPQSDASVGAALCFNDQVVPDTKRNVGPVNDYRTLLEIRDTLAGDEILYWTADSPMREWSGITIAGNSPRIHALESDPCVLLNGTIPPEISELTELRVTACSPDESSKAVPATKEAPTLETRSALSSDGGRPRQA